MSESTSSAPSPIDFLAEVERILTPTYAECFTDETRKIRNLLLVTSLVLILFVFGVVAVGRDSTVPLLGVSISVTTGMRVILMILCIYFLVSFAMRSYTEWKLWRLRHQAPMIQFLGLLAKIESSWQAFTNESNRTLNSGIDALRRLTESNLELIGLEDHGRKSEIKAEREELLRRLTELENVHRSQTAAPEVKLLEAQLSYLGDALRPAGRILRIRSWWEMLFPIGFGVLAIISGVFWR